MKRHDDASAVFRPVGNGRGGPRRNHPRARALAGGLRVKLLRAEEYQAFLRLVIFEVRNSGHRIVEVVQKEKTLYRGPRRPTHADRLAQITHLV